MIFKKRELSTVTNFSFTLTHVRQRTRHNNVSMMLRRASFIWFKNTKYFKSVCRIIIIRISCVIRPIMKGDASYCF